MNCRIDHGEATLTTQTLSVKPFPNTGDLPASYPWPELQSGDENRTIQVETVHLTNGFFNVTCVPAFGCRIASLHSPWEKTLTLQPTGPRGVSWPHGIEFLAGRSSEAALARADVRTYDESSSLVGLICGSLTPESDWHSGVTLAENEPWITIDVRLHSRSWFPSPGECGIRIHNHTILAQSESCVLTTSDSESLLVWWDEPGSIAEQLPGAVDVKRASGKTPLGPRSTRTIKLRLASLEELTGNCFLAPGLVLCREGSACRLWSAKPLNGSLHILPQGGDPVEAPVTLIPGQTETLELPPTFAEIEQAAVKTQEGILHLNNKPPTATGWNPTTTYLSPTQLNDPQILGEATDSPAHAPVALTKLACRAAASKDWAKAAAFLDRAVGLNPEDQFLWWLSAAVTRESGAEAQEDRLMNAHFLAPHEPLLRVESFLGAITSDEATAAAILTPFKSDPDAAVDVAGTLAELEMDVALFKFAEEVLRLVDVPLLRYILADRFLKATRMEATAAEHVTLASRAGLAPPFPYRPQEIKAVLNLADRFPQDPTLAAYADLARRATPQR